MREVSTKEFKWKKNALLFENEVFMGVVPDEEFLKMWYIRYPDGGLSDDYYNKTRAKEHCLSEARRIKTEDFKSDSQE